MSEEEEEEDEEELEEDRLAQFEPRASSETFEQRSNSQSSQQNVEAKQFDITRIIKLQRPGSEASKMNFFAYRLHVATILDRYYYCSRTNKKLENHVTTDRKLARNRCHVQSFPSCSYGDLVADLLQAN